MSSVSSQSVKFHLQRQHNTSAQYCGNVFFAMKRYIVHMSLYILLQLFYYNNQCLVYIFLFQLFKTRYFNNVGYINHELSITLDFELNQKVNTKATIVLIFIITSINQKFQLSQYIRFYGNLLKVTDELNVRVYFFTLSYIALYTTKRCIEKFQLSEQIFEPYYSFFNNCSSLAAT